MWTSAQEKALKSAENFLFFLKSPIKSSNEQNHMHSQEKGTEPLSETVANKINRKQKKTHFNQCKQM